MPGASLWRFDGLSFDAATGELCRLGEPVRLQSQPARLLALLLEGRGAVVSHQELRRGLWPDGTFVDFEGSLHVAVHKLREALGDAAARVQTVPGQGYRFAPPARPEPTSGVARNRTARRWFAPAAAAAVMAAWAAVSVPGRAPGRGAVAVLPLRNVSAATVPQGILDGLDETLASALAECGALRVVSTTTMRRLPAGRTATEIARALGVNAIVEGSVAARGGSIRVVARLIDAESDLSLWSGRYERGPAETATDEVARAIAQNVKFALLRPGEVPPPAAAPDPWPLPVAAASR